MSDHSPALENMVLGDDVDVIRALLLVEEGVAVRVMVDDEDGPDGPEPRIAFLRQLLDEVQRRFTVEDREYVPHPWLDARYLRSCVVRPVPPRGRASGVRGPGHLVRRRSEEGWQSTLEEGEGEGSRLF